MRLPPLSTYILVSVAYFVGQYLYNNINKTYVPELATTSNEILQVKDSRILKRQFKSEVHYKATLQRPLFAKSRRLQKKNEEPKVEVILDEKLEVPIVVSDELEFVVHGIIMTEGNKSALISVSGGQKKWFREKQRIKDWLLFKINSEAIVVNKKKQSKTISLYKK